jgi:hypothetical protein
MSAMEKRQINMTLESRSSCLSVAQSPLQKELSIKLKNCGASNVGVKEIGIKISEKSKE